MKGDGALTINKLDESRVLVVLAQRDMSDFALDFQSMDMQDDHSRRILLRLTRLACRKSGIDFHGRQVHIEALTVGQGCYLLVTVRQRKKRFTRKRGGSVCYEFSDSSTFLNAVEAAYRLGFCTSKNAAYQQNGAYYLLYDYPALPKPLHRLLTEFGKKSGGALFAAHIKEHGIPVCRRCAVETVGRYLC